MGASFTLAGEDLIAQKQAAKQTLTASRFVLANVPGLNPNGPVDRAAGKPSAAQIVATYPVTQAGYVNPSQVVYSLMLGSDVGDFDWNWIGLESAEGVLLMVAYVPTQQKRRNIPPLQLGNNVTRNFLLKFDGAQALTGVTIDASTWQHDFTVRLTGIDERERQSNRDIFGRACFFGSSLQLEKVGAVYQLKPGTAYIEGVRITRTSSLPVTPPGLPAKAWLDVGLVRELSDVVAAWKVVWGADKADYTDEAGARHFCVPLAELLSSTATSDLRSVEPVSGPLVNMFAFRSGDYASLRARATTKEDVGLGNLPNAKSDDPTTNSSEILATTAALNAAMGQAIHPLTGMCAAFARSAAPEGWLKANGAAVSRTTYAALFAVIGTTFGAGDGATTFNLPDMRGEFLRGWDDGRGVDVGRALGSAQAHMTASHNHTASAASAGGHSHSASSSSAGSHTHNISGTAASAGEHTHSIWRGRAATNSSTSSIGFDNPAQDGVSGSAGAHTHSVSGTAASAGDHAHTVTVESVGDHAHTVTVNAAGGIETRPRNIAWLFCIKY